MKIENPYLDRLAGNQDKLVVFDCEFWHVHAKASEGFKQLNMSTATSFFFTPREIGGLLFTKLKKGWKYHGNFYATLERPPGREVAFPISHYATVTGPTGYKLDELEGKLGLPWGEAFPHRLSKEGKAAYEEGIRYYEKDPLIQEHHKPASWMKTLMNHMSEAMVVVKGTGDLDALQNACKLYGFEYKEPAELTDIALWNQKSYKMCRTAKLEGSYLCIKNKTPDEIGDGKTLQDILPLGKSHDPSVDASMTLIVALYIVSKEPM